MMKLRYYSVLLVNKRESRYQYFVTKCDILCNTSSTICVFAHRHIDCIVACELKLSSLFPPRVNRVNTRLSPSPPKINRQRQNVGFISLDSANGSFIRPTNRSTYHTSVPTPSAIARDRTARASRISQCRPSTQRWRRAITSPTHRLLSAPTTCTVAGPASVTESNTSVEQAQERCSSLRTNSTTAEGMRFLLSTQGKV